MYSFKKASMNKYFFLNMFLSIQISKCLSPPKLKKKKKGPNPQNSSRAVVLATSQ